MEIQLIVIRLGGLRRDQKTQNQIEVEFIATLKANIPRGNVGKKCELVEILWVEADVFRWEKSGFQQPCETGCTEYEDSLRECDVLNERLGTISERKRFTELNRVRRACY